MIEYKVLFKNDFLILRSMGDYMDSASLAGSGKSAIETIYRNLQKEGEVRITTGDSTISITNTEELFKWLKSKGYDHYVNELFAQVFINKSNEIRYG